MSVCASTPPRSSGFLCKACGRRRRWRRRHGRSPIVFFLRRLVGSSGALLDAAAKGRVFLRLGSPRVVATMKPAKKKNFYVPSKKEKKMAWNNNYIMVSSIPFCPPMHHKNQIPKWKLDEIWFSRLIFDILSPNFKP